MAIGRKMKKQLLGVFAVLAILSSGSANAVPCGYYGIEPSGQCQDGIGARDSQDVLNSNAFLGFSNWQFLDRVDTQGDFSNRDFWRVTGAARGLPSGTFELAPGLWDQFWKLGVALKGGGAYAPGGTEEVNWSLYMLVPGQNIYDWVYGATRSGMLRNLFTITLYGIVRPTSVAEPLTALLMVTGLGGMLLLVSRRREVAARA